MLNDVHVSVSNLTTPKTVTIVTNLGGKNSTSLIREETPSGDIDGNNRIFQTVYNFNVSALWVYLNGLLLNSADYDIILPNKFMLSEAPEEGDLIIVDYYL